MRQRSGLAALRGGSMGMGPRDEMDLVAFTDFVLAWDHRSHPAAIKYFFPIMDLSKTVGESAVFVCTYGACA